MAHRNDFSRRSSSIIGLQALGIRFIRRYVEKERERARERPHHMSPPLTSQVLATARSQHVKERFEIHM
jgi:hypothetical protein